jgi:hypothetical protein
MPFMDSMSWLMVLYARVGLKAQRTQCIPSLSRIKAKFNRPANWPAGLGQI